MKPAKTKLTIYQGATFRKRFTWYSPGGTQPIDLTGCTARMQVRLEIDDPAVLLDLTTENGGITLGGVAGTVDLLVSDTDTSHISWDTGVFDLEIKFANGDVVRMVYGPVVVSPEVTRSA